MTSTMMVLERGLPPVGIAAFALSFEEEVRASLAKLERRGWQRAQACFFLLHLRDPFARAMYDALGGDTALVASDTSGAVVLAKRRTAILRLLRKRPELARPTGLAEALVQAPQPGHVRVFAYRHGDAAVFQAPVAARSKPLELIQTEEVPPQHDEVLVRAGEVASSLLAWVASQGRAPEEAIVVLMPSKACATTESVVPGQRSCAASAQGVSGLVVLEEEASNLGRAIGLPEDDLRAWSLLCETPPPEQIRTCICHGDAWFLGALPMRRGGGLGSATWAEA